jgi:hypothetical protein
MDAWQLILILGGVSANTLAFIWLISKSSASPKGKTSSKDYSTEAENEVEHIFSTDFREELRNRGRLHFEKIIGDNAMFLQQDLRLTTSQLNDYMKGEITKKLQEEFQKYEQSINDAKQLAVDSIDKTQSALEEQRLLMGKQLQQELAEEKERLVKSFQENMADIVNHYVMAAIGDQIDLTDQLEYIINELQSNKDAIIRDITDGA